MPLLSGTRRRADFILLGSVTADVRFGPLADILPAARLDTRSLSSLTEIKERVRVKREMLCKEM